MTIKSSKTGFSSSFFHQISPRLDIQLWFLLMTSKFPSTSDIGFFDRQSVRLTEEQFEWCLRLWLGYHKSSSTCTVLRSSTVVLMCFLTAIFFMTQPCQIVIFCRFWLNYLRAKYKLNLYNWLYYGVRKDINSAKKYMPSADWPLAGVSCKPTSGST